MKHEPYSGLVCRRPMAIRCLRIGILYTLIGMVMFVTMKARDVIAAPAAAVAQWVKPGLLVKQEPADPEPVDPTPTHPMPTGHTRIDHTQIGQIAAIDSTVIDPALALGTLPNGMRYYIKRNAHPAKRAMLWLVVNAGAINEDDDQRGYAHFLEHMAFNGTRQFPGNTLIDVIEQAGMTFGADLNAYTSFDETVYQLTMPTDDSLLFRRGLDILTDWADGSVLVDSAEVVGERGVVLGEWRVRLPDTASSRLQQALFERLFGAESKYVHRFPIGTTTSLQHALPEPIKRFYTEWYRPDLMAVVAVGDFDPARVQQDVIARFGAISKPQSPQPFVRPAAPSSEKTVVHVIKDKVTPLVEMNWAIPTINTTSEAAMRLRLLEHILFSLVQRTLTKLSKQERRPFASATIGRSQGYARPIPDHYSLRVASPPDSLYDAFRSALTELERIAQHGIITTDLESQKTSIIRQYESAADGATAIESKTLAQRYTQHYLTGNGQLWNPAQALALVQKILPTISSNDVAAFARRWRTAARRTVTYQHPDMSGVRAVNTEQVFTLLDSLVKTPLSLGSTVAHASSGALMDATRIQGGQIVSEATIPEIDVTAWTLSNGARVVFKETDNNPDAITIHAHSLGGHSLLPNSLFFTSPRLVGMLMTASGGLAGKGHDQLQSDLSGTGLREFRVDLNAFDEEIAVGGSPRELETLFQLLQLQFTNPTIDTTSLEEWRRTGGSTLRMSANDRLAAQFGRNVRLGPPQPVNVQFVDLAQAMRVYRERFGDASDFTFYIVGAATAERVKPLVERYLASLPSTHRTTREVAKSFKIPLPLQRQVSESRHPGLSAERAQTTIQFNGAIPANPEVHLTERRKLQALSWVLGRRLRNRLREQMAVTYSVSAPVQLYQTPDWRYVLNISLVTSPEDMPRSIAATWEEIDSLRQHGPTEDELAMVTTILRRGAENARQTNDWWIARMQLFETLGIPLAQLDVPEPVITANDITTAMSQYLPKDVYTQSTILPTLENIEKKKSAAPYP